MTPSVANSPIPSADLYQTANPETEQVSLAVTPQARVREALCSNLCWDTGYTIWGIGKCLDSASIQATTAYFQIHTNLPAVLPFDAA
jgi:hypothetical protein